MNKKRAKPVIKIAPKSKDKGSWTNEEWLSARDNANWEEMIQIFFDRMNGRYLTFIKEMKEKPYSGFVVISINTFAN